MLKKCNSEDQTNRVQNEAIDDFCEKNEVDFQEKCSWSFVKFAARYQTKKEAFIENWYMIERFYKNHEKDDCKRQQLNKLRVFFW